METSFNPPLSSVSYPAPSVFSRFWHWCDAQQPSRLLWVGIALSAHGCILTPLTLLAILASGGSLVMILIALVAMGAALVTNLAAMPTKYTIPVFLLSALADLVLIVLSAWSGFDMRYTTI